MRRAAEQLIRFCGRRRRGFRVLLAALPCTDILNAAEPEKYAAAMDFLRRHCDSSGAVVLFDCNPEFSGRYELFADPIHLNPKGQKVVSEALGRELKRLLPAK